MTLNALPAGQTPERTLLTFALVGNQNCGKTTLFNRLTGMNQRVGNFPGVTVEKKEGVIRGYPETRLTDLPGVYSLTPYSGEERVTYEFLLKNRPSCIINIADVTALERNLYLTMQLAELGIPMVLALNMMDELRESGGSVRVKEMEELLGMAVVPISAAKNEGTEELVLKAVHAAEAGKPPAFFREKQKDPEAENAADMSQKQFSRIHNICGRTVIKPDEDRMRLKTAVIDRILTGKYTGIPALFGIMGLIFWMTFGVIGAASQKLLEQGLEWIFMAADRLLFTFQVHEILRSLFMDGLFKGIGSVLSFLPVIVTLFYFLSILEDSGYMARAVFLMDEPLWMLGLSGRSVVSLLMGFGCTVPGVMAARTLCSERERKMTVFLLPFMSCSAKLPVYAFFAEAFFPGRSGAVLAVLYGFGIFMGILLAVLLNGTAFPGEPAPFFIELPNYRMPGMGNVLRLLWEKAKDFLARVFTVVFLASAAIWFLKSFDIRLRPVSAPKDSILAVVSGAAAPVFSPLGFGDWRIVSALMTGFLAKEGIVSTLSVLFGSAAALGKGMSGADGAALLVFSFFYPPCAAAFGAVRRELGGFWAAGMFFRQLFIAWVLAFAVHGFWQMV